MAASCALHMSCVVPSFLQTIFVWQILYVYLALCFPGLLQIVHYWSHFGPILYFCFLLAQFRINFGQISVYHAWCLPCILHVHYWVYSWLCLFTVLDSCKLRANWGWPFWTGFLQGSIGSKTINIITYTSKKSFSNSGLTYYHVHVQSRLMCGT